VCGEMASDPLLLRLLVGCGLTEFSMTPGALLMARRVVSETGAGDMARIAARVMTLGTVEEIERVLVEYFGRNGGSGSPKASQREGGPGTPEHPGGEGGRQEVGTK